MDYNEREAQRRQEDRDLNRALIWVGAAVVLEFLLSLINKYYINFRTTPESINLALAISAALNGLRWVSLAALAACVVWVVLRLKQGGPGRPSTELGGGLCRAVPLCADYAGVSGVRHSDAVLAGARLGGAGPGVLSVSAGVFLVRLGERCGCPGPVVCPPCRSLQLLYHWCGGSHFGAGGYDALAEGPRRKPVLRRGRAAAPGGGRDTP